MSLSTTIKSLQDIMRKDAGVDGDAQRIGQLGWMLFFKIYSDLELEAEIEDERLRLADPDGPALVGAGPTRTLSARTPRPATRCSTWSRTSCSRRSRTSTSTRCTGKTRERGALLRGVFEDAFNYMKSGTLLRQVINKINARHRLQPVDDPPPLRRHLRADPPRPPERRQRRRVLHAARRHPVRRRDGRPAARRDDPRPGVRHGRLPHPRLRARAGSRSRRPTSSELLKQSIHGVEKKSLPHLLCVTNMMIHGIEVPSNIRHDNTLARPLRDYGKADQVDIILTNPPFGGMEEDGIENNFPAEFRTRETADLFLVLVMELLKDGGRAAIVLPDGTLFGEGIKTRIKKKLLEECNLHTIVRLPNGVFAPYTTHQDEHPVLHQGRADQGGLVLRAPLPRRLQELLEDQADADRGVRAREGVVDGPGGDRAGLAGHRRRHRSVWLQPRHQEPQHDPATSHEDPDVLLDRYLESSGHVSAAMDALKAELADALRRS